MLCKMLVNKVANEITESVVKARVKGNAVEQIAVAVIRYYEIYKDTILNGDEPVSSHYGLRI